MVIGGFPLWCGNCHIPPRREEIFGRRRKFSVRFPAVRSSALSFFLNDQEPEKNHVVNQPLRTPRFVGIPLALPLQNPKACSGY